jgi:hypothetical protein
MVDSETVAKERRTRMADRTRGAWPQRMRALADTASTMVIHNQCKLKVEQKVDMRRHQWRGLARLLQGQRHF